MVEVGQSYSREPAAALRQAGVRPDQEVSVRLALQQSNTILTADQVTDLVGLYRAGSSLTALSRQFDIHEQTVRAHLCRQGVTIRPQHVFTTGQSEQVVAGYIAGKSLRTLAREFDVSTGSIRNYVLRAGVALRPPVRPSRHATSTLALDSLGQSGAWLRER